MAKRKTDRELPAVGDTLIGSYKGQTVKAKVVAVDRDRPSVQVKIGRDEYRSLSSAAKSITGNWVNGWVFWGLESKPPRG